MSFNFGAYYVGFAKPVTYKNIYSSFSFISIHGIK